jgi:hypothetical protein
MKKFVLLSVLGLGVCVNETQAGNKKDDDVFMKHKIHKIVEGVCVKNRGNQRTIPEVQDILKIIKAQLLSLTEPYKDGSCKELYSRLTRFSPENQWTLKSQLLAIMAYLPAETISFLKQEFPEHLG